MIIQIRSDEAEAAGAAAVVEAEAAAAAPMVAAPMTAAEVVGAEVMAAAAAEPEPEPAARVSHAEGVQGGDTPGRDESRLGDLLGRAFPGG
eukprot:705555-Prorocentrum_minimum.AAC.2